MLHQIEDFLDPDNCSRFIEYYRSGIPEFLGKNRAIVHGPYRYSPQYDLATSVVYRAQQVIVDIFEPTEPIYLNTALVNHVWDGGRHEEHVDNSNPLVGGCRRYTALLYLNETVGGEIYFPQIEAEIKPKPGLLITFPCTDLYRHEVKIVPTGSRFAFGMWFTDIRERAFQSYLPD